MEEVLSRRPLRILLLTQWFDPEPTPKGLEFARALVERGFSVEVLTGFPNYPGGKLYPGYRVRLLQRELIDGVQVTRVPLYPDHGQSALRRVLNYASFATTASLYGLFGARRPDVIYAYHPPLTVGVAAVLMRLFRRVPVVYDIQDMWPDTLKATGMIGNPTVLRLVDRVCRWVYRHVDHLVVLSPGFKKLLTERGVAEDKIDVIYNWCNEAAITSSPADEAASNARDPNEFQVVFAGNLGKAQSLDTVLDAAELLLSRAPDVCFVFIGSGVDAARLRQSAQDRRLHNVRFLPQVPMAQIGALLSAADVLLVHLKQDPLFEITIPSKTQAYLVTGKPIVMAVAGDAAALVRDSGGGMAAEPENAESIAAAIMALRAMGPDALKRMGRAGADFYWRQLSLRVGLDKFSAVFHRVAQ